MDLAPRGLPVETSPVDADGANRKHVVRGAKSANGRGNVHGGGSGCCKDRAHGASGKRAGREAHSHDELLLGHLGDIDGDSVLTAVRSAADI